MSTQPINANSSIVPGTLCEPCAERGRRRQATRIVGDSWWCDYCYRGADEQAASFAFMDAPPKYTPVSVAEIIRTSRGGFEQEWMDLFRSLQCLPDDAALLIEPQKGRGVRARQETISRAAKRYGMRIRTWVRGENVYVAERRGNGMGLADLRRKQVQK